METFSALLAICAVNSPATGEFPAQRPVTRSFDVFSNLCLNKRLSKQSRGWWFETPSCSLWRHCNVTAGNSLSGTRYNTLYIVFQRQDYLCAIKPGVWTNKKTTNGNILYSLYWLCRFVCQLYRGWLQTFTCWSQACNWNKVIALTRHLFTIFKPVNTWPSGLTKTFKRNCVKKNSGILIST